MGRAGSGRSSGGRSSGGGHSSSRSSGGHRVSSSSFSGSSRARSSSFSGGARSSSSSFSKGSRTSSGSSFSRGSRTSSGSSFSRGSRSGSSYKSNSTRSNNRTSAPARRNGPGMPPPSGYGYGPGAMPPRYNYGPAAPRSYGYGRRSGSAFGSYLAAIIIFIMIISILVAFNSVKSSSSQGSTGNRQTSTIVRKKLDTDNAYMNNCIIDEIDWFENTSKTSAALKEFWEDTGVQPYIILRDYDPSLTTDSDKEQWTVNYYDTHFDTENIFLFVYFAEEDVDNDIGYMCYANGMMTSSVMDSEAIEIFWNNIDRYWYTDLSTDDVFINAFTQTGNTIMHVSTTGKDIAKWVLIVLALLVVGTTAIILVTKRNKRAKEEAEERQRILDTPVHDIAGDDLENKYL